MNTRLQNKNVLLICVNFFDYHREIIKGLENLGAKVDYFDERPSNSPILKGLLRINKKLIYSRIKRYYKNIIDRICRNKYDYILIIKPEAIPKEVIQELKVLNPDAKVIIEIWDSIANNKEAEEKIKLVDKAFSFDPRDCEKYKMNLRPLFYIEKYNDIAKKPIKSEYDLLFVGTVHSDRYKVLKNMEVQLKEKGLKPYYYMYLPSRLLYFFRKFFLGEFHGSKISEFKFKSMNQEKVINLVKKSKVILDIQHPKQVGLTMRTIEMLGANKKIITTNENVKKYDFYNEKNIYVIDRAMVSIDMKIFQGEYQAVPEDIKRRYSLEEWLMELLD